MTEVSASIIATTQTQEISDGVVELYQLTSPNSADPILYFHGGVNESLEVVQFRDSISPYTVRDYVALPLHLEKTKLDSDGATNRPTLTVANVSTTFSDKLGNFNYDDLIGYTITLRTTLENHLSSGSGTEAPVEFPQVSYLIDRIANETNLSVTFELAVPFDLENVKVPRRVLLGKYCNWQYKGIEKGRGGGCTWSCQRKQRNTKSASLSRLGKTITTGNAYEEDVFLNSKDEYILDGALVSLRTTFASSGTTYNVGDLVLHDSKTWLCTSTNDGATPSTESVYWELVHFYTSWSSGAGAQAVGDYVKHSNDAWICSVAHTASGAKAPDATSVYWNFGDVCGKTLQSCTRRFNVKIRTWPPQEYSNGILPFGAFPGSDVFK